MKRFERLAAWPDEKEGALRRRQSNREPLAFSGISEPVLHSLLMPKIEEIGFFCKLYLPRKNIFAIILPVVTAQVMMQKPFWGGGAIG